MKGSDKQCGSVSIIVLLLCLLLAGVVQALYHSLRGEAEAADECILRRQLQTAANSALAAALTLEQRGELADSLMLPEQKLYPANTLLQVEVLRQKNELLPGRKLTAQAVAADKQITLTTVCLQPPLGQGQKFYQNTLTAGSTIEGDPITDTEVLISAEAGPVLQDLDVTCYEDWSRYSFLTAEEYKQLGFGKRISYNKDFYGVTIPSLVRDLKGDAFLIAEPTVTSDKNLHLLGRITLVVGDNLIIGDNVQLEQVLLVVKNNLHIGANCGVKGVIVAGGTVTIGDNFILQRDERVLAPYHAAVYLQ